ncbi:DUF4387 domain-containing protein [Bosea sp. (in: a-proteobacteria)]|jgi:hypothetical protein|uniref:DUF4387 domain-containing protein n=1 Tax=Bosea sp. (in: a-proteobacteria) TaxID=1871050 RepID=UPI001AC9C1E0|nr:DUF4387 domain-containing protein [Bosea sp. (in: a-proteobacteria)]MBN9437344.1 DUF4387 domain-containing protein [Bosea sp. (in: a-proteobacteria)]
MSARPLREIADIVRSKNAGPYRITFDILCKEKSNFELIRTSGAITPQSVAKAYGLSVTDISSFFEIDMANAIKITIKRPRAQGSAGEGDMYGCQQHVPLMNMLIPLR